MARVYNRYHRVLEYIVNFRESHGRYPDSKEVARTFKIGDRAAQKFLKQFFQELGE